MALESERGIRIKCSVRWFSAESFITPNDGCRQSGIKSKGLPNLVEGEVLELDVDPQTTATYQGCQHRSWRYWWCTCPRQLQ